ncbi:MAG TPA: serine hydrolase domain-containing protein [Thermoanaerobaculia bacterium]|jgi:CubicO group peptidase (beta-lactamase class C family)|nr:serine hydrolase domain-containing protein [Thermoanaerobaculia bacterium]
MSEGLPRGIEAFLGRFVSAGAASAAVALKGTAEAVEWEGSAGWLCEGQAAEVSTRFDLASLTKPFFASLALVLDAEGVLPLGARIGEVWPEAHRELARRPLSDLLRHRSGLAAWTPLYHLCRSADEAFALIARGGREGELLGARAGTYSDLGYMLWGATAERWTGLLLAELIRSRVLAPLGLSSIAASPGARPDLAESRMGTGQEVRLAARQGLEIPDLGPPPRGQPQDGNARFLVVHGAGGGVCGHAGLFGGVRDLWRLGAEWLAPGRMLKPEGVADALRGGGPFALGWRRRTLRGSAGRALPPTAFGHTGFAGNSLWIDPERRQVFVLLASRLDPATDMNRWRRRFHTLAAAPARQTLKQREASADGNS